LISSSFKAKSTDDLRAMAALAGGSFKLMEPQLSKIIQNQPKKDPHIGQKGRFAEPAPFQICCPK
jgi:hypothetical protein